MVSSKFASDSQIGWTTSNRYLQNLVCSLSAGRSLHSILKYESLNFFNFSTENIPKISLPYKRTGLIVWSNTCKRVLFRFMMLRTLAKFKLRLKAFLIKFLFCFSKTTWITKHNSKIWIFSYIFNNFIFIPKTNILKSTSVIKYHRFSFFNINFKSPQFTICLQII